MNDAEITKVLKDIVVIYDSREKENGHILEFFDKNNIIYKKEKLNVGDYSFILPNNQHLGIDKRFLIERKNSLSEIAGNIGKHRERFIREFERINDERIHLVLEDGSWDKLLSGEYRSEITPNSLLAGIMVLSIRYNCPFWFTEKQHSGKIIYNLIKYEIREFLKNNA